MNLKYLFLLFVTMSVLSCSETPSTPEKAPPMENPSYKTTGSIERLDARLNALISKDATIEILAEGFTWIEGPLWVSEGQYLLFSDIPPNQVNKWSEAQGVTTYLDPSGYTGTAKRGGEPGSNGLLLDQTGQLVLCQHGDRRIAKMSTPLTAPSSTFETIVGDYKGQRFHSPNDAVFDRAGNLYFTDPPYGMAGGVDDPAKELTFNGVYRHSLDGTTTLITDQLTRPNGIGLSPDEKTLYVANSDPERAIWMAYDLDDNGTVVGERVFYDATGTAEPGLPDGLKVDQAGHIWATGPGGVWVFDDSANVLGKIKTGQLTSNCAFDDTQQTLYMTCDDYLMRIKL